MVVRDTARGPGKSEFWYEDDQRAALSATPGDRDARSERVHLISACLSAWQKRSLVGRPIILDSGCGDGVNLQLLGEWAATLSPPGVVVGLDRWTSRLGKATTAGSQLVQGDVLCLPLRTGSVSAVLISHVLEHIADPETALREILRVCEPGALVVIAVPNEGCFLARIRNHAFQRGILTSTDHVHFFTLRELTRLARGAGLDQPIFIGHEGFFFPHTRITSLIRRRAATAHLERFLRKLAPSQAAGLVIAYEVDKE